MRYVRQKTDIRIVEAANHAITDWYYTCTDIGTFYSKRGKRTHRGKKIN